jgi:DNA-binding transcriptional LysR family regulator
MSRDLPPLGGLDLNLLVTLRALLREVSVTRAAETIGQTQPTVSRSLATLRTSFNDPLLVRSGRRMALTPKALSLATPLERLLAGLDRLAGAGAFEPATDMRTFRVVLPDLIGQLLVPELTRRVTTASPGSVLQVLGNERDVVAGLLSDTLDLAVIGRQVAHPELMGRRVGAPMGWSVLYGPQHPAHTTGLTLETWLATGHIVLAPAGRPDRKGGLDEHLDATHVRRTVALHLGYLAGLGGTLETTPLSSSLPTPVAVSVARDHDLTVAPHPMSNTLPPVEVRMVWHQLHQEDAGHRWLRTLVAEVCERLLP